MATYIEHHYKKNDTTFQSYTMILKVIETKSRSFIWWMLNETDAPPGLKHFLDNLVG